jgi:hypothetical protein
MIALLPAPTGAFALAQVPEQLQPGRRVQAGGQRYQILGSIVCIDKVEAWLECLLQSHDTLQRWLAVEVRGDGYRTTLWHRTVQGEMPSSLAAPGHGVEIVAGTASFHSVGAFGDYPIPSEGLMTYREFFGAPATAAEQFEPGGPWLVGRGDGAHIEIQAAGE